MNKTMKYKVWSFPIKEKKIKLIFKGNKIDLKIKTLLSII